MVVIIFPPFSLNLRSIKEKQNYKTVSSFGITSATTLIVRVAADASNKACSKIYTENYPNGIQPEWKHGSDIPEEFAAFKWVIIVVDATLEQLDNGLGRVFRSMKKATRLTLILKGSVSLANLPLEKLRGLKWLEMDGQHDFNGDADLSYWFNADHPIAVILLTHMKPDCFSVTNDFQSIVIITADETDYETFIEKVLPAKTSQLLVQLVNKEGTELAKLTHTTAPTDEKTDKNSKSVCSLNVFMSKLAQLSPVAKLISAKKGQYNTINIGIDIIISFSDAWTGLRGGLEACEAYALYHDSMDNMIIVDDDKLTLFLSNDVYIAPPAKPLGENKKWTGIKLTLLGKFDAKSPNCKLLIECLASCESVEDLEVSAHSIDVLEEVIELKRTNVKYINALANVKTLVGRVNRVEVMKNAFFLTGARYFIFGMEKSKRGAMDAEAKAHRWTPNVVTDSKTDKNFVLVQYKNDAAAKA